MTLQQATDIMRQRDTSRSYCATKKVWTNGERVEYDIAMFPGAMGAECSIHHGATIQEAVEIALGSLSKSANTDDNQE